jgi:phospholipid/cholesterol/gamma-HCH transport system substrate-binding protein
MAILRDEDKRYKHLEQKIGWFVLVAVAGIVLTVLAIGINQGVFSPKTHVYFVADSGQDIVDGQSVKLSGFHIGRVSKLALTEAARVQVTLSINSAYMKWIKQDARARLVKEGVIGDTIIEIVPGSATAELLGHENEIAFVREMGFGRAVDELYQELVPLLEDLKRFTHYLGDPEGDFRQTLNKSNVLLTEFSGTRRKLDIVLKSAARNLENLEKTTTNELSEMVRSGREVFEESQKVVDSMSRTWPFNSAMEQPAPIMLPLDSYGEIEQANQ